MSGTFRQQFDELLEQKRRLEGELNPLRERRDALAAQIAPVQEEMRKLAAQMQEQYIPRMVEIDRRLSALARLLGGRRMSDGR